MKSPAKPGNAKPDPGPRQLYTLEVALVSGPIPEEFAEENPVISRTIEIRSDQTLEKLHYTIFDAFEREEEHMYEFQVGGKKPNDPKARCYVLPDALDPADPRIQRGGDLTRTRIGSLGLKLNEVFGYWFDFGDDWWHQITVTTIEDTVPEGKFPRVTASVGESPPQYEDWDEDFEGDDEENEEFEEEAGDDGE